MKEREREKRKREFVIAKTISSFVFCSALDYLLNIK